MDSVTQRYPNLPQRLIGLEALSSNLWWSWHPAARMVFKMLDRPAWKESGHNPVRMLGEISREILESAAADPEYLRLYDDVVNQFQQDTLGNGDFFSRIRPDVPSPVVVYFSAEYGVHRFPSRFMPADWDSLPGISSRNAVIWGFPWRPSGSCIRKAMCASA